MITMTEEDMRAVNPSALTCTNGVRMTVSLRPQPVTVQILNFSQERIFGVSRVG